MFPDDDKPMTREDWISLAKVMIPTLVLCIVIGFLLAHFGVQ